MTSGKEGDHQWRLPEAEGKTKLRPEKVNMKEQEIGGGRKDKRIGMYTSTHWRPYEKEELVMGFYNRHN